MIYFSPSDILRISISWIPAVIVFNVAPVLIVSSISSIRTTDASSLTIDSAANIKAAYKKIHRLNVILVLLATVAILLMGELVIYFAAVYPYSIGISYLAKRLSQTGSSDKINIQNFLNLTAVISFVMFFFLLGYAEASRMTIAPRYETLLSVEGSPPLNTSILRSTSDGYLTLLPGGLINFYARTEIKMLSERREIVHNMGLLCIIPNVLSFCRTP